MSMNLEWTYDLAEDCVTGRRDGSYNID